MVSANWGLKAEPEKETETEVDGQVLTASRQIEFKVDAMMRSERKRGGKADVGQIFAGK